MQNKRYFSIEFGAGMSINTYLRFVCGGGGRDLFLAFIELTTYIKFGSDLYIYLEKLMPAFKTGFCTNKNCYLYVVCWESTLIIL